jgi:hypothetical protein
LEFFDYVGLEFKWEPGAPFGAWIGDAVPFLTSRRHLMVELELLMLPVAPSVSSKPAWWQAWPSSEEERYLWSSTFNDLVWRLAGCPNQESAGLPRGEVKPWHSW